MEVPILVSDSQDLPADARADLEGAEPVPPLLKPRVKRSDATSTSLKLA